MSGEHPPGWTKVGPGIYDVDIAVMLRNIPLDAFHIHEPVGYTEDNNSAVEWTTENLRHDEKPPPHTRPKPQFLTHLKRTKHEVKNPKDNSTRDIDIWDLTTWKQITKPYWKYIVSNLTHRNRNKIIMALVREQGAYGDEFTDVDMLATYLGGCQSGLLTNVIKDPNGGDLETLGIGVIHVGLYGGGRSRILQKMRELTPFHIELGMTASLKGVINTIRHCPVGPIIEEEFGEGTKQNAEYQRGKPRVIGSLLTDRRVVDNTIGRGQEVAEVLNISLLGASNNLDSLIAEGKLLSLFYYIVYPNTQKRSHQIAEARRRMTPTSFDEVEETRQRVRGVDPWCPEVMRLTNLFHANLVSGRLMVEWNGKFFHIPPVSGFVNPHRDWFWDTVRDMHGHEDDEETVFSATRLKVLGQKIMWNSAICEIANRRVRVWTGPMMEKGYTQVEVSESDAAWGLAAVDRQLPLRVKHMEDYHKKRGRITERQINERNNLLELLMHLLYNPNGLHIDKVAKLLGVTPRMVRNYVRSLSEMGFNVSVDKGLCRLVLGEGNEK